MKIVCKGNNLEILRKSRYLGRKGKLCKNHLIYYEGTGVRNVRISPDLVEEILNMNVYVKERMKKRNKHPLKNVKSPKQIYDLLNRYIIGQDSAKKALSVAVYNHYQRMKLTKKEKERVDKNNILFIGPTGTGKTYMIETLGQILDVPFILCNATEYTETGYVGGDVTDILWRLYEKAGKDIERAEYGIVYIDEIDKIACRNPGGGHYTYKDVSGESVQQELLGIIEGREIICPGRKGSFGYSELRINAENILFIAGGAFAGLEEIVSHRIHSTSIGFGKDLNMKNSNTERQILKYTNANDLIQYGMIPELVGRLHNIIIFNSLSKQDLVEILTRPKNGIINQYKMLLRASNIDFRVSQAVLEWIAEEAIERGTGARGLRSIIDTIINSLIFDIVGNTEGKCQRVILNENIMKEIMDRRKIA